MTNISNNGMDRKAVAANNNFYKDGFGTQEYFFSCIKDSISNGEYCIPIRYAGEDAHMGSLKLDDGNYGVCIFDSDGKYICGFNIQNEYTQTLGAASLFAAKQMAYKLSKSEEYVKF